MTRPVTMMHMRRILLFAAFVGALVSDTTLAQNNADDSRAAPLEFRRILVPADRIQEWPLDKGRYVPVKPAEFERLYKSLQTADNDPSVRSTSRVVEALYTARLKGSHLVDATATMDIIKTGDTVSMLSLSKCRLAITAANWLTDDDRPATIGMAPDGDLTALVERSGQLALDWTLRGRHDLNGAIHFQFDLPRSPVSTLLLDLPPDVVPIVSHGVVSPQGEAVGDSTGAEASATTVAFRRWKIELGGNHRMSLHLVTNRRDEGPLRLPLVRQSSTYDLSRRGIEITQRIEIAVEEEPLRQLSLEIDPELRLLAARLGETRLPWSIDAAASETSRRVTLELPEPIVGTGHVIEVAALAPLDSTSLTRLPRIRALDTFWQEGTATLRIESPLSLRQLRLTHCRRTGTGRLVAAQSGELIELQDYSRDAVIELHVAERTRSFQLSRATTVKLGASEASAVVAARFTMTEGELYEISADVAWPWIIDSLESTPDGAVAQWSFDEQDESVRRLRIRLSQAVLPNQPLALRIRGRRVRSPLGETLGIEDLLMLSFTEADVARQLLALHAAPPYQLRLSNDDDVSQLDPDTLVDLDKLLLPQIASETNEPAGMLLSINDRSNALNVTLRAQQPGYTARVHIDATIVTNILDERYTITCRPMSAPLDRVLIHFSQRRDERLTWALEGQATGELRARRLDSGGQVADGFPAGGETWEVVPQRPQSEPFVITARREVVLSDATPASLASLPDALSQSGELTVHSNRAKAFTVINHRLKAVPNAVPSARRYSTVRASYSYRPAIDADPAGGPALTFSQPSGALEQRDASIWDLRLESRCEANGHAVHRAILRIENHGKERISFALPTKARDIGVWIDGTRVPRRMITDANTSNRPGKPRQKFEFDLPANRRFVAAAIRFSINERPLRAIHSLSAPFPVSIDDTPTLSHHWKLWLPPGFETIETLGKWRCEKVTRPGLASRLFGPLARLDAHAIRPSKTVEKFAAIAEFSPAWTSEIDGSSDAGDFSGWTDYELHGSGLDPASVRVANRESLRGYRLGLFFLVAAACWWLARERPSRAVLLVGLFAIAAVAVPVAYVPFCSMAFLGASSAGLAAFWHRMQPSASLANSESREKMRPSLSAVGSSSLGLFVGLLSLLTVGRAMADGADEAERPPRHIYDVLIPADERGKPTGDRYQVPLRFLDELHLRAAEFTDEPRNWLLERAVYRGKLSWNEGHDRITPELLKITFDLQIFGRAGSVSLPLGRDWLTLLPDSVRLDGQRVSSQWQDEGSSLIVEFPDPGQHQLELTVRPTKRSDTDTSGFDLVIPPSATSRLELELPTAAPAVDVPSALGIVSLSEDGRLLKAALGATDRMSVRWRLGTKAGKSGPNLDVHELLWLKVQQESVVLDVKFIYTITDGGVRRLVTVADPLLRLLPTDDASRIQAHVSAASHSVQSIEFEMPNRTVDEAVIKASFLLTGASGVGNLRLPRFDPVGVRSRKRWLAVSVDESLEHELDSINALEPLSVAKFLADWGPVDEKPPFAIQLPSDPLPWHLVTRPHTPQKTARSRLALSVRSKRVDVRLDAELACTSGLTFQHQVQVPANLEIETVSIIEEQVESVSRWSRNEEAGEVTIFLNGAVRGTHSLTMTGSLPVPEGGQFPLPDIHVRGFDSEERQIELYRQEDAIVELDALFGLVPIESTEPTGGEPGRLVQAYSIDTSDFGGLVRVRPNRPNVNAVQVTTVRRDGDTWEAEVDCQLTVTDGVLDEFEFDIPARWTGPFEADPPHDVHILDGPEGARRRLLIRPRAAVSGADRFVIRGKLSTDSGEPIRAPRIRLLGIERLDAYLILPTQFELQQVAWETHGLAPTTLPEQFHGPPIAPESFAAYQVAADDFDAVLRSVERAAGVTQVHLVDVRMACLPDASYFGVATFDFDPGGATNCPLWLPPGSDLVQLLLDGLPAMGIAISENKWEVNLGPEQLPQRIEVVYRGRFPNADKALGNVVRLDAPSLGDLAVERTLWTVEGPASIHIDVDRAANQIAPLRREWLRLRNVADVLELGTSVVTNESADGIGNWYRGWQQRLLGTRSDVRRLLSSAPTELVTEIEADIVSIEEEQAALATRLRAGGMREPLVVEAPVANQAVQLWDQVHVAANSESIWMFPGGKRSLEVQVVGQAPSGGILRIAIGALIGLFTLIVLWGMRRNATFAGLKRWSAPIGVGGGVAWSLWLTPTWFGGAIIAWSLWAAFRQTQQSRRASSSAVVPIAS